MDCPVCHGRRYIQMAPHDPPMPCSECNGFASVSCCGDAMCEPEDDEQTED